MSTNIINNQYNNSPSEYGQNNAILHIALWQGEKLPKNYIWYGLGQEVLRKDYLELFSLLEKFECLVTEEEWQDGQYGKFSYGNGETTFRFPLIRDGDVLTFTDVSKTLNGMKIEPELPNITGNTGMNYGGNVWTPTGAFYSTGGTDNKYGGTTAVTSRVAFAASRSNLTYKNGGTVKQSGIATRMIIKYK